MLEFLEFVASRVHCTSVWYPKFKERRSCLSTLKRTLDPRQAIQLAKLVDREEEVDRFENGQDS